MYYDGDFVNRRDRKRDRKIRNNSLGKNLNLTGVISNEKIDSMWESLRPSGNNHLLGTVIESRSEYVMVMVNDFALQAKYSHSLPAVLRQSLIVGDDVILTSTKSGESSVAYRKPRHSFIARRKIDSSRKNTEAKEIQVWAANIDIAIIVVAAANPAFHPNMVDRYLLMAQFGGVRPLICYNKSDLVDSPSKELDYYSETLGIQVICTSTEDGRGIEELREAIFDSKSILLGLSGVGKTSITNALLGDTQLLTKNVGVKSHRGKHTTTDTKMYKFADKSWIIDSPGIRSLDVTFIDRQSARFYFDEIAALGQGCKYRDCLHIDEPDCDVRLAVEDGRLARRRYESYLRVVN